MTMSATFGMNFNEKNRRLLTICASITAALVCFGIFYQPSHHHFQDTDGAIPQRFRHLGSMSPTEYEDQDRPYRAGACANVGYANQTYLDEIDMHSLPLNELLIKLDHPHYVMPPNHKGPTVVDIGIYMHNVFNLDPGLNTFEMEGYLDLVWCDPHTKFDPNEENTDQHVYLERDAAKELEAIWWPAITFINEKGKRITENQEVIIDSDGTVEYREKFKVTLYSKYEMGSFPFDKQVLRAEVESFAWNHKKLVFHLEEDIVGFSEDFEIPEQKVTKVEEHLETVKEARDRFPFSELVTEIHVTRNPAFYVTKVCVPLGLIVAISWAVFWMDPADLADRMAISISGVLTSAAYQFVVTDILPRHVTNTFLANFVLVTFVMQILIAVENVLVRKMHCGGHRVAAKMVDRICRVVVPLFFLAVCNIIASAQVLHDNVMSLGGVLAISILMPALLIVVSWYMVRRYKAKHPEINGQPTEDVGGSICSHRTDIESGDDKNLKDSSKDSTEQAHFS